MEILISFKAGKWNLSEINLIGDYPSPGSECKQNFHTLHSCLSNRTKRAMIKDPSLFMILFRVPIPMAIWGDLEVV